MLFDAFDSIRIINLAHRTDRRAEMSRNLERVGLEHNPKVAFFAAIAPAEAGAFYSKGAHGAYLSHLAVLENAAAAGRSVLVLEDDVDFGPELASYSLPAAPSLFYGAYTASDPADLHDSDIMGAHFMGFDAVTAGRVAAYLRFTLAAGIPVDGAYVRFRRDNPDVRAVFAPRPLGYQRPSRTDIAPLRLYDRLPILRGAMGLARKAKRARMRS